MAEDNVEDWLGTNGNYLGNSFLPECISGKAGWQNNMEDWLVAVGDYMGTVR